MQDAASAAPPGGARPEQIVLDFPTLDIRLRADLAWGLNPEACRLFVDNLPFTTIFSHTTASGQGMYAPTRAVGRVKATHVLLSEMARGTVTFSTDDYKTLGLFYGRITEPLPGFPPVAQIVREDMPACGRVGREVWISNYMTKDPVRVTVSVADGKEDA